MAANNKQIMDQLMIDVLCENIIINRNKPLLIHVHDIVMHVVMYVHVAIKNKLCDQVKI